MIFKHGVIIPPNCWFCEFQTMKATSIVFLKHYRKLLHRKVSWLNFVRHTTDYLNICPFLSNTTLLTKNG